MNEYGSRIIVDEKHPYIISNGRAVRLATHDEVCAVQEGLNLVIGNMVSICDAMRDIVASIKTMNDLNLEELETTKMQFCDMKFQIENCQKEIRKLEG